MAEIKKSIIEEALLDYERIQEALQKNTKEILRSVAIEEIDGVVKESINEDMYDEEDVDDADTDVTADVDGDDSGEEFPSTDVTAAPAADTDNDLDGGLDLGAQEGGLDLGAEEGGDEDYDLDLTGASDEDVISVYKKLAGDDEIEVISPNEVTIKDPVSGAEYNVKLGGEAPADTSGIGAPTGGLDLDLGLGGDDEDVSLEPETPAVPAPADDAAPAPANDAPEAPATDDTEEEDDDELGESVVYEIALGGSDEEIDEDIIRGKGHDKHLQNGTMDSGEIEGTKADKDADSGDNLTGGFDDDAVTHANAEGPMVMGENEEVEEVDEQITQNRVAANRAGGIDNGDTVIGQPVGPGAKSLEEANKRYNTLLAEARKLKVQNEEFNAMLKKFKQMLGETVVFNSNLTYVTKLFLEHSTTPAEKKTILGRFDNDVKTLAESQKLYKTIARELGNKTPISESVETKITKEATSSSFGQITESTAYVDQSVKRIQDLIKRTEKR